MKKIIVSGATAGAGLFGLVARAFAQTPTPYPTIEMDPGVQAAITGLFSSYVGMAFALIGVVILVVGVLWISMKGIGLLFRYFHLFGGH